MSELALSLVERLRIAGWVAPRLRLRQGRKVYIEKDGVVIRQIDTVDLALIIFSAAAIEFDTFRPIPKQCADCGIPISTDSARRSIIQILGLKDTSGITGQRMTLRRRIGASNRRRALFEKAPFAFCPRCPRCARCGGGVHHSLKANIIRTMQENGGLRHERICHRCRMLDATCPKCGRLKTLKADTCVRCWSAAPKRNGKVLT